LVRHARVALWVCLSSVIQPMTRTCRKRQSFDDDDDTREEETPVASEFSVQEDADDHLSSITEDASKSPKPGEKLNYSQAIIEIGPVGEMLTRHLVCLKCQNPLSTDIAFSCKLVCANEVKCDYVLLCLLSAAVLCLNQHCPKDISPYVTYMHACTQPHHCWSIKFG